MILFRRHRRSRRIRQQQQYQFGGGYRLIYLCLSTGIIIVWIFLLKRTVHSLSTGTSGNEEPSRRKFPLPPNQDDVAYEIPGIEMQIPFDGHSDIQVVYAMPTTQSKGLVLLLHACTQSALKFMSPSPTTCAKCVGLAEELRMVRLVLEQGYTPIAVSSVNRKRGCWSSDDVPRMKQVLKHALFQNNNHHGRIFAMGASSGGSFAAQLVEEKIVQAALVMVMALSSNVIAKLQKLPNPILYLAPMPRDKGTTQRTIQNHKNLANHSLLDTTSCDSLPVTSHYLIQRVPGMTTDAADTLIRVLEQAHHLTDATHMLQVDPTRSDWRSLVSPNNATCWLKKIVLTPGYSPLAKALHRAWAFHEYCSEVVIPALRYFEQELRRSS